MSNHLMGPTLALASLVFAAAAGCPSSGWAQCTGELSVFYGSIPAAGATNVATNTRIIAFTAPLVGSVTVDGIAVETPGGTSGPLDLTPNAEHELHVGDERITFTTGAGPTDSVAPEAPVVDALEMIDNREYDWSQEACPGLLSLTGCPDNGPVIARFDVARASVGWFIHAAREGQSGADEYDQLWPASCGTPLWYGTRDWPATCFDVSSIDEVGRISPPTKICETTAVSDDTEPDAGPSDPGASADGCSAVQGRSSGMGAVLCLLLGVLSRRKRRSLLPPRFPT